MSPTRCVTRLAPALLLLCAAAPLRAQSLDSLRSRLDARIAESHLPVGLYFRSLSNNDSLAIAADTRYHAASTMKVPVMVQVFREIDARRLRLNDRIPAVNSFRSIADGSEYTLDAADDSDSSLYRKVGREVEVRELVELMITVSSNLATNILVGRVTADSVRVALREVGAESTIVLRGVEDGPAFRAGMNNSTTARSLGTLLAAIADGRAASAASCGEMVRILQRQRFNEGIPAGLPRGTRVAHKTGWTSTVRHDAAIVYWQGRPRYVLVILTGGGAATQAADALMADLAGMVNGFAVPEAVGR